MIKSMMFSAVIIFAAGPESVPVSAKSVPLPSQVVSAPLEEGEPQGSTVAHASQTLLESAQIEPGSQKRVVQVLGRSLSLSLMRAERMGLAVLTVPKRSVITILPDLEPNAFRSLVAVESGCRPVGQVQVVGSRGGTLALATGLSCS